MKINRNGQEFELTQGELVAAYLEQASIYDQDNIRGNMEGYLSPDVYARLKDNKAFIENAASKLRESQDDSMGYDEALASAIKAAEKEFRIPVNRVTILRERYSEHQIWPDDYWVDCNRTPSIPSKQLFFFTENGDPIRKPLDRTISDASSRVSAADISSVKQRTADIFK